MLVLKLTQDILDINDVIVAEQGAKKFENHYDVYALDEWTAVYMNKEPEEVCESLKEILNSPEKFSHISDDFNIIVLEAIIASLIESDYKGSEELRKNNLLSQYIRI
jgi:hypothetical protein